ncbi:erythrocyte membrane protein 1, PfEMP1, putative [Plasmodium sp. DRC-Itaito]|nr:erythrocyte membrane protein 1, PfEMP1, putative [Plasmodium sp. DRC-Itaito]
MLDKLKEEWDKYNYKHNGDNIPSSNKMLSTDVSIQIDMDKPNQMENTNPMDQNPLLVENNINPLDTPTKAQIELSMKNSKMANENFPIGDVWDI